MTASYSNLPVGTCLAWRTTKEDGFQAFHLHVNCSPDSCATVWDNGVWHTWDQSGTGGENSSESTVQQAMHEAIFSAINQGFTSITP